MGKIDYPKQQKIITKNYKKRTVENGSTQLENLMLQIDELQTAKTEQAKQTDILQENKQNTLTFDTAPTSLSTNPVTSGGVYNALMQKQDALTSGFGITISDATIAADTSTLATKADLAFKQDVLTAGANITISGNTISSNVDTSGLQNQIDNNANSISNLYATKQGVLTFDLTPTQNSNHVVTSGGVYDAIQNISGGGGLNEVTASDVNSESATNGQVLTADGNGGATWQTVSAGGNTSNIEIDYDYNPQTIVLRPDDITIYQNHAKFSRRCNKTFSGTATTCNFVFSANANSNGTLKLCIKILSNQTFAGVVTLFNNDTQIATETFSYQSTNLAQYFETEFLNITLSNGNVFYATITPTPSNVTIKLLNVEAELFAPNAEVINQISPFNVEYFNGKYYISDCSCGTAKIAEIEVENIQNISSLNWFDTGIECYKYKTSFSFENTNNVFVVKDRIDYYQTLDSNIHFDNKSLNNELVVTTYCEMPDWVPTWNMLVTNYATICRQQYIKITGYITINHAFTYASVTEYSNKPYSQYICASKLIAPQNVSMSREYGNLVMEDLSLVASALSNSKSSQLTIGKGTNAHSYILVQDANNPVFTCYAKLYNKIIKYDYLFTWGTKSFTLTATTEIGAYDEYFEGVNNDYFVVKNGVLEYHKKPTQN